MIPILGPKVRKYYLLWAVWIPRDKNHVVTYQESDLSIGEASTRPLRDNLTDLRTLDAAAPKRRSCSSSQRLFRVVPFGVRPLSLLVEIQTSTPQWAPIKGLVVSFGWFWWHLKGPLW